MIFRVIFVVGRNIVTINEDYFYCFLEFVVIVIELNGPYHGRTR